MKGWGHRSVRALVVGAALFAPACTNDSAGEGATPSPTTTTGNALSDLLSPDGSAPAPKGPCQAVVELATLGTEHLAAGQRPTYPTFPPASGPHDEVPLDDGVYDEPLVNGPAGSNEPTLAKAVHSLEHGYVLIFHKGLSAADRDRLEKHYRGQRKVIVAPATDLSAPIVLVSWLRQRDCSGIDFPAMDAFVKAYVEGPNAPEPLAP